VKSLIGRGSSSSGQKADAEISSELGVGCASSSI
jgi:hypothetical protein